jgi:VIT1/CCC1 family predicted Fe2+/Mn2+ transporter
MESHSDHTEQHITLSPAVRDIIIGLSDGLTVPFAIAAGLASAAAGSATIIITAVLAEIAAGSISMGLGGYLAADTEAEHYANERRREEREVEEKPEVEKREVTEVFEKFGLTTDEARPIVEALAKRKEQWINFMMQFELGLEEPDKQRAIKSAATIGGAYIVGGLIPLSPYLFLRTDVPLAFLYSILVTLIALLIFGYIRGRLIMERPWRGMIQTVLIGALAATAAFLLAKLVP